MANEPIATIIQAFARDLEGLRILGKFFKAQRRFQRHFLLPGLLLLFTLSGCGGKPATAPSDSTGTSSGVAYLPKADFMRSERVAPKSNEVYGPEPEAPIHRNWWLLGFSACAMAAGAGVGLYFSARRPGPSALRPVPA